MRLLRRFVNSIVSTRTAVECSECHIVMTDGEYWTAYDLVDFTNPSKGQDYCDHCKQKIYPVTEYDRYTGFITDETISLFEKEKGW